MIGAQVQVGDIDPREAVGGDTLEDLAHVVRAIGARREDVVDGGDGAVDLGGGGDDGVVDGGGRGARARLSPEGAVGRGGEVERVDDGREEGGGGVERLARRQVGDDLAPFVEPPEHGEEARGIGEDPGGAFPRLVERGAGDRLPELDVGVVAVKAQPAVIHRRDRERDGDLQVEPVREGVGVGVALEEPAVQLEVRGDLDIGSGDLAVGIGALAGRAAEEEPDEDADHDDGNGDDGQRQEAHGRGPAAGREGRALHRSSGIAATGAGPDHGVQPGASERGQTAPRPESESDTRYLKRDYDLPAPNIQSGEGAGAVAVYSMSCERPPRRRLACVRARNHVTRSSADDQRRRHQAPRGA